MLHAEHSRLDGSIYLCSHDWFLYRLIPFHETVLAMQRPVEGSLQFFVLRLVALCKKKDESFKMNLNAIKTYVCAHLQNALKTYVRLCSHCELFESLCCRLNVLTSTNATAMACTEAVFLFTVCKIRRKQN